MWGEEAFLNSYEMAAPDTSIFRCKQFEIINNLRSQIATTKDLSKIRTQPYAFTRNGIGILRGDGDEGSASEAMFDVISIHDKQT